uniref:Uncharacterized protein n=1 Tax=Chrysotila carterae TaxID=13221 RepID=A0A7S4B9T6_CHRCT
MGKAKCPPWCSQYTCQQWQCKTCTDPGQTCQPPPFPPLPPPPLPSPPPSPSPPPPPRPELPFGVCPCAVDGERMRALSDPSPAEGGGGGGYDGGAAAAAAAGDGGGGGFSDGGRVSATNLTTGRRAAASTAEHPCFWDESCPGYGCNAFGFPKCRFCGFELFNRCPVSPPPPAPPLPIVLPPPPSPPPSPAKPPLEAVVEEADQKSSKRVPTSDREDDDDENDDDDEGEDESEEGDEGEQGDEGDDARISDETSISYRSSQSYIAGFSTSSDGIGRRWGVSSTPSADGAAAQRASLLLSASESGVGAQTLRPANVYLSATSSMFLSTYTHVAGMTLFLAGEGLQSFGGREACSLTAPHCIPFQITLLRTRTIDSIVKRCRVRIASAK